MHPDEIIRLAALDRGEIFATDVVFHFFATNKKTKKEELHLRILYEDGTQRDHAVSTIRDLACVQWYICTHPDLYEKYGSMIGKKKSERERRYTELRAMYTRPEEERQILEEEQRATNNVVQHPITPQIPQVTFDNSDSKSKFKSLQHVYDKSSRRAKRGTKEFRRYRRLQKHRLRKELQQGDKRLKRIKRTRRVAKQLEEHESRERRHSKRYKREIRREKSKTRNKAKRNKRTRENKEISTLQTTRITLQ